MNRKAIFYLITIVLILLFTEFSFRAFYAVAYKNASILVKPSRVIEHYYAGITEQLLDFEADDDAKDLLLLGGSVLNPAWGDIEKELNTFFANRGHNVRIHNLAMPAHTSLDSRLKYNLIAENRYDAVLVYHGINELRFNNCPEEMFKADYTHVDFYAKVYNILKNPLSRFTILPLVVNQFRTNVLKNFSEDAFMNFHNLDDKGSDAYWSSFGGDIKTAKTFESNLLAIVDAAEKNETNVLLPSFAYHIDSAYTLDKFKAKTLAYTRHINPIELLGTPDHIKTGLEVHNGIITSFANRNHVEVIALNNQLDKTAANFDDICHLTTAGSAQYAELVGPYLVTLLQLD